jgi:hypothetical protein
MAGVGDALATAPLLCPHTKLAPITDQAITHNPQTVHFISGVLPFLVALFASHPTLLLTTIFAKFLS